ncbi:DUF1294 domain-containing protein [Enterococcus sp. LJL128]|uniref:DUF1294 domain-containing protein n=1 Tax=Enterococcus sp. LJL51 TaxID=3416656 RepID=UPI003CF6F7E8
MSIEVKLLGIYLAGINLYVLFMMYYDKQQAKKREWRVSESRILAAGFLGGGPAGLLSQQLFHHKTRKFRFYLIFGLGTIGCIAAIYYSSKYF